MVGSRVVRADEVEGAMRRGKEGRREERKGRKEGRKGRITNRKEG